MKSNQIIITKSIKKQRQGPRPETSVTEHKVIMDSSTTQLTDQRQNHSYIKTNNNNHYILYYKYIHHIS